MEAKYTLFGREGLTQDEFDQLVNIGVVKKDESAKTQRKIKVKRKMLKKDWNGKKWIERFSDKSGENDSCYTLIDEPVYEDNEESRWYNRGIQVRPLDEHIYGKEAARQSIIRFKHRQTLREAGITPEY